jgi:hypothetical protein
MKKWVLALLIPIVYTPLVFGQGWHYERYWTGCGWGYRKVYYQQPYQQPYVAPPEIKKEQTTTVINNLIGIPVPVQYTQPVAQQGTTVYGYSTVAESYGNIDLGLLYNQAARLSDQAQQLAGQAAADFQSLVQSEGQNRAEVAKIVAQGQAARDALLAAKGSPPQLVQRSFTFKVSQDARGEMKVERVEAAGTGPDFNLSSSASGPAGLKANLDISNVIKTRCVSCHGSGKASGGLNFLQSITDAQQQACLDRITSPDPDKRMPKGGPILPGNGRSGNI